MVLLGRERALGRKVELPAEVEKAGQAGGDIRVRSHVVGQIDTNGLIYKN